MVRRFGLRARDLFAMRLRSAAPPRLPDALERRALFVAAVRVGALAAALAAWFEHYDTSQPFSGELYLPRASTGDEGLRSTKLQTDAPLRTSFSELTLGGADMLGYAARPPEQARHIHVGGRGDGGED